MRVPDAGEIGVLLAEPRGPIDPTASVKRGVFAPADTWISTEYLFRRDDRRRLLVGGQARFGRPHRARDGVLRADHRRARADSGVDLAVTYGVPVDGHQVAVAAVTLRPGATITAADLTEASPPCRSGWDPTSCMWCRN